MAKRCPSKRKASKRATRVVKKRKSRVEEFGWIVTGLYKHIRLIKHRAFSVGVSRIIAEYALVPPPQPPPGLKGTNVDNILREPYPDAPVELGGCVERDGPYGGRRCMMFCAEKLRKKLDIYHPTDAEPIRITCEMNDGRVFSVDREVGDTTYKSHTFRTIARSMRKRSDVKLTAPSRRSTTISPEERTRYTKVCSTFFKEAVRMQAGRGWFMFRGIFNGLVGAFTKFNAQYNKIPKHVVFIGRQAPKRLLYFNRWPSTEEAHALVVLNPDVSFGIPVVRHVCGN